MGIFRDAQTKFWKNTGNSDSPLNTYTFARMFTPTVCVNIFAISKINFSWLLLLCQLYLGAFLHSHSFHFPLRLWLQYALSSLMPTLFASAFLLKYSYFLHDRPTKSATTIAAKSQTKQQLISVNGNVTFDYI